MSTGGGSIFGDMIDWLVGKPADRRQYQRRAGAFQLWWQAPGAGQKDAMHTGIGLELSPNGIVFMVEEKIASPDYNLVIRLEDVKIPIRVHTVRTDQVQHKGKAWNRYAGEFTGIAADNWDRIVRYVNNQAEPEERKPPEAEKKVDDAYRLLPLAVQQKIMDVLIKQQRLDAPKPGHAAQLRLFYAGALKRPGKNPAIAINVHSRVTKHDELVAFDSRFAVDQAGNIEMISRPV